MGPVRVGALWLVVLSLVRIGAAPPEHCPTPTVGSLRASATAVIDWYERNQYPDGRWIYAYDAKEDRDLQVYESLRHAASMMSLYQAAVDGFSQGVAIADRADQWAVPLLTARHGGLALAQPNGQIEIGASALYLAGLVYRQRATGDHQYDERMQAVARFLAAVIEPSGAVAVYDVDTGPLERSPYPTAQVFWALAMMHRSFPDQGWDRPAREVATYLATRRDEVENLFPTWSDHWAAYGYSEMTQWPGRPALSSDDVNYVRRLAGVMSVQVRWESQRTGGSLNRIVRGDYAVPSGLGTLGEGLSALWATARTDPRLASLPAPIAERVSCAAGMLTERQATVAGAAAYPAPGRVVGAWFQHGRTRLDDQQHTLSTMLPAIGIFQASGGALPNSIGSNTSLSGWLMAVALVLAFDPFRFGFRSRVAGFERSPRTVGPVVGLVVVALVLMAAVASPALERLHISAPTARVAVALVVLAGALVSLVQSLRWAASTVGAREGVGVFALTELRPGLLLLALVVGADHGVLPVAIGASVAAGLAMVEACRDRWWNPSRSRWASGLCTVAVAVVAVALLVDGVFSV